MIEKFLNLSIKTRVIIILIPIIIVGTTAIFIAMNNSNNKTEFVNAGVATSKNLGLKEEVALEVKEEIIVVAQDTTIDDSLKEEAETVTFEDKEVKIPTSKVSSLNSSEDAESNKKTGGSVVSQKETESMFENVGTKSMGIDVSHHQGKIDWAQVKASGVEFAIIRVGYRGQTSGGIYEDAYFKTNITGAIANGIKVGVYFYSTAVNENEALEEAAWVVRKISTYNITYPVVYDFEDFNAYRCANVGGAQATSNALTYLSFVKSNGYEPMMYANKGDITSRMSRGSFPCKFWLAHYTSQTDYTGNYNMWQYTSKGTVPGISGYVDMNIAYFSYGNVAAAKHTHSFTEEVKNSYVAPTCTTDGSKVLRCSCGDTETEKITALGHTWSKWEGKIIPTVDKEGLEVRKCSTCKKEETQTIDKLETNTNTNTDSNTNTNTNTNTDTNNTTENNTVDTPHTHKWEESSRIDATCTSNGKITYKCSDSTCLEIKEDTETLTALGHNYENGICTRCLLKDSNEENENTTSENITRRIDI